MSTSVVINFIIKIYNKLNLFYENSVFHKILKNISKLCMNSFIISKIYNAFTKEDVLAYKKTSVFILIFYSFSEFFIALFNKIYNLIKNKNKNTINNILFMYTKYSFKTLQDSIISISIFISGFIFVQTILYIYKYALTLNLIYMAIVFIIFLIISMLNGSFIKNCIDSSLFKKLIVYCTNVWS